MVVWLLLIHHELSAVVEAYNNGYYQTPREANMQSIADREKVPRTTLQEHLNKAEKKLILAIIPQMLLYVRKSRGSAMP